MKKRPLVFALLSLVTTLALYGACGFPDLEYASGTDGSPSEAASGDDSPAQSDADADADAGDQADVVSHDSSVSDGAHLDEASVEAGCCDCDGDHYRNATCDAAAWPDSAAQTFDCDDLAPDIHPDKDYTTGTWPATSWTPVDDWNCSSKVEYQYNTFNQDCSNVNNCTDGYAGGNPGCGNSGLYNVCEKSCLTVLCSCAVKTTFMALPQGCK